MEFEHSEKVRTLQARVKAFMVEHTYLKSCSRKSAGDRWQPVPLLEELINGGDGDRTAEHGEG